MRLRHEELRKKKVKALTLYPKKKTRHEKYNLKELIKKCDERYVDFQQARSCFD